MLTGEQLRAARAMLKIEQGELAVMAGVSAETIKRLERMDGTVSAQVATVMKIRQALEADGIIFIPENGGLAGVRLRRDPPANIRQRSKKGPAEGSI